jgi:hypothetical protein
MTIRLDLPPATLQKVQDEADATGKDVETVVREAVEVGLAQRKRSLVEVLKPINEAIQASGMSDDEVTALFDRELQAHRTERRSSTLPRSRLSSIA